MKNFNLVLLITTFVLFISSLSTAQLLYTPNSPEFHPDGTVTLRLIAPEADNVKVDFEFLVEPRNMIKEIMVNGV